MRKKLFYQKDFPEYFESISDISISKYIFCDPFGCTYLQFYLYVFRLFVVLIFDFQSAYKLFRVWFHCLFVKLKYYKI